MASVRQRFVTEPPSPEAGYAVQAWRERYAELAALVQQNVPEGREKALALTNLEQAKFWTNQAIVLADNDQQRAISEGENE